MKTTIQCLLTTFLIFAIVNQINGQEDIVDQLTVSFSDPSQPGYLEASLVNGGISVVGYNGKEVIIEARARLKKISKKIEGEKLQGMIHIPIVTTGLEVEEDNNRMEVRVESWRRTIDLDIKVPVNTSLKLHAVNHGDITVEKVTGEIEIENINGRVTLTDISGSVMAHALNKPLTATLKDVFKEKSMSFSTLNGDIDVTLPKNIKANVKLKSDNGEIYSDFDMKMEKSSREVIEENNRDKDGKYRVKIDNTILASINGGGPEIQFTSFQGDIIIRKGK
jgi:DUF4097 and DUF4098 domain-containing protein YvlB